MGLTCCLLQVMNKHAEQKTELQVHKKEARLYRLFKDKPTFLVNSPVLIDRYLFEYCAKSVFCTGLLTACGFSGLKHSSYILLGENKFTLNSLIFNENITIHWNFHGSFVDNLCLSFYNVRLF